MKGCMVYLHVQVNGMMMGLFVSSIALGQCVLSPITGVLMKATGAQSVPSILLLLAVVGTVAFLAWMIIDKIFDRTLPRRNPINDHGDVIERTSLMMHNDWEYYY